MASKELECGSVRVMGERGVWWERWAQSSGQCMPRQVCVCVEAGEWGGCVRERGARLASSLGCPFWLWCCGASCQVAG